MPLSFLTATSVSITDGSLQTVTWTNVPLGIRVYRITGKFEDGASIFDFSDGITETQATLYDSVANYPLRARIGALNQGGSPQYDFYVAHDLYPYGATLTLTYNYGIQGMYYVVRPYALYYEVLP